MCVCVVPMCGAKKVWKWVAVKDKTGAPKSAVCSKTTGLFRKQSSFSCVDIEPVCGPYKGKIRRCDMLLSGRQSALKRRYQK